VLRVPLALVLREKMGGHRFFRLTILIPITVTRCACYACISFLSPSVGSSRTT
jgi:hypothetical protein